MKYEKKAINKKIYSIIETVSKDREEIESIATKKGFYITLDEKDTIHKKLRFEYKYIDLTRISFDWDSRNKYEHLTNEIFNSNTNKEYNFLNMVGFQEIDIKKETVTLRKSDLYYLRHLKDTFGIEYEKENIKEFQNGKVIIKFKDDKTFNSFLGMVYFTNKETEEVLNNITKEDIKIHKESMKIKSNNLYNTIWEIRKRLNLNNTTTLNFYVILKKLKELVKNEN